MEESALNLKEKTPLHWFSYFQIDCKYYLKSFKTHPLNIIFDDFGLWLPGYRNEFSCLYIPQGYSFISILWLWSTDEYVNFWIWMKVHL